MFRQSVAFEWILCDLDVRVEKDRDVGIEPSSEIRAFLFFGNTGPPISNSEPATLLHVPSQ